MLSVALRSAAWSGQLRCAMCGLCVRMALSFFLLRCTAPWRAACDSAGKRVRACWTPEAVDDASRAVASIHCSLQEAVGVWMHVVVENVHVRQNLGCGCR